VTVQTNKELLGIVDKFNNDPAVTRCDTCGLVQYRTRTGNCRRCVRVLPQDPRVLIPHIQEVVINSAPVKCVNRDTVENIGQRIRQLRESRAMTQSQLQCYSRVSRSYLSRIESGQMTPSLGTLEKIADALNIGLNRFFVPEANGEAVMEDPFIQSLRPYLKQLHWGQWKSILQRLRAIGDAMSETPSTLLAMDKPERPASSASDGNSMGYIGAGHSIGQTLMRSNARLQRTSLRLSTD
jgi:transcriptional regulator with XRE-family HTH domain